MLQAPCTLPVGTVGVIKDFGNPDGERLDGVRLCEKVQALLEHAAARDDVDGTRSEALLNVTPPGNVSLTEQDELPAAAALMTQRIAASWALFMGPARLPRSLNSVDAL